MSCKKVSSSIGVKTALFAGTMRELERSSYTRHCHVLANSDFRTDDFCWFTCCWFSSFNVMLNRSF